MPVVGAALVISSSAQAWTIDFEDSFLDLPNPVVAGEIQGRIIDDEFTTPGLIDPTAYEGLAHVIFLVVAALDEDAFRSRFAARGKDAGRRPPHRYVENLDSIQRIQDHVLELAETHDVPIVDNEHFDASVLSIVRHVTETLRKKEEFDVRELL